MTPRVLFITGRLAEPSLRAVLETIHIDLNFQIWNAGVKVAALITEAILINRLPKPVRADRVILPGRCRVDLERLSHEFGVPFEKGPDEVKDLPRYFGKAGQPSDLTRHDLRLFAEIVDAPLLSVDELEQRATILSRAGADVIDLGCIPDRDFQHLEEAIIRLRAKGFRVSVDSADLKELERSAAAGADYLLSLNEFTVHIATPTCRPVLVPTPHGDLDSLLRAYERAKARNIDPILDPILDPIHFGFSDSIARYRELRSRAPDAELMMGTGNLTELTEADTSGVTALLLGICSELNIANALTVNVSPHTSRTLQEHDIARRIMYAAHEERSLPKGFSSRLLQIHETAPFPYSATEIAAMAALAKDDNFRIQVNSSGIHLYNRKGHWVTTDPSELFQYLGVNNDGAHAFYLGAELQKAEIAFRLGKRYVQDEPLDWGVATESSSDTISCKSRSAKPPLNKADDAAHK